MKGKIKKGLEIKCEQKENENYKKRTEKLQKKLEESEQHLQTSNCLNEELEAKMDKLEKDKNELVKLVNGGKY